MSLSRFSSRLILAGALACLTLFPVMAKAATYLVLPGAKSAPINLPFGARLLVAHVVSSSSDGGLASITVAVDSNGFINWVGLEAGNGGTPALVQGRAQLAGAHIAYIDRNKTVAIEVSGFNQIVISNKSVTLAHVALELGTIHE
jgi:hypothetical protein